MRFGELVAASATVASTSKRLAKVETLAGALRGLRGSPPETVAAGAAYLSGELRQRQTGVGWASLRDLPPPAAESTLEVGEVDAAFAEMAVQSGAGSTLRRRELVRDLFSRATAEEQDFLARLVGGELRQGAQAGLLVDAIAKAAEVPVLAVRRALLLSGDLTAVARAALDGGAEALAAEGLRVGRR